MTVSQCWKLILSALYVGLSVFALVRVFYHSEPSWVLWLGASCAFGTYALRIIEQ